MIKAVFFKRQKKIREKKKEISRCPVKQNSREYKTGDIIHIVQPHELNFFYLFKLFQIDFPRSAHLSEGERLGLWWFPLCIAPCLAEVCCKKETNTRKMNKFRRFINGFVKRIRYKNTLNILSEYVMFYVHSLRNSSLFF